MTKLMKEWMKSDRSGKVKKMTELIYHYAMIKL